MLILCREDRGEEPAGSRAALLPFRLLLPPVASGGKRLLDAIASHRWVSLPFAEVLPTPLAFRVDHSPKMTE